MEDFTSAFQTPGRRGVRWARPAQSRGSSPMPRSGVVEAADGTWGGSGAESLRAARSPGTGPGEQQEESSCKYRKLL